jgi:hypothetical protein
MEEVIARNESHRKAPSRRDTNPLRKAEGKFMEEHPLKRMIFALAIAAGLAAGTYGAASSLIISDSPAVQYGADTDLRCDTDGVQVYITPDLEIPPEVQRVVVAGINGACDGHTVRVQLTNAGVQVGPTMQATYVDPNNVAFDIAEGDQQLVTNVTDVRAILGLTLPDRTYLWQAAGLPQHFD